MSMQMILWVWLVLWMAGFQCVCDAKKKHKTKIKEVSVEVHGDVLLDANHASNPSEMFSNRDVGIPHDDRDQVQAAIHNAKQASCIASIQQELKEIDELIQLQQQRLRVLSKLRESLASDATSQSPPELDDQLHSMLHSLQNEPAAQQLQQQMLFDNYFVPRLDFTTKSPLVDVKTMTFLDGRSPQTMLLLAQEDGLLHFVLPDTLERVVVDTKQRGLVSVLDDLENADGARLVALDSSGQVVVYHFGLAKSKRLLVGKNDTFTSMGLADAVFSKGSPLELAVFLQQDQMVELSARPTAIRLITRMKKSLLAVAFETGDIGFYLLNGTVMHQLKTVATPGAQVLVQQHGVLAIANGTQSVVYMLAGKKDQPSEFLTCDGTSSNVTSMVFDVSHSSILYSATQQGEILVHRLEFDQHIQQNGYESVGAVCRLLFRTVASSRHEARPLQLAMTKGYIMAASQVHVAVYNTSYSSGRSITLQKLFSSWNSFMPDEASMCPLGSQAPTGGAQLAVFGSQSASSSSILARVTPSSDCHTSHVQLYQNLLPFQDDSYDWSWMVSNSTLAATLVIFMVVAQVLLKKCFSDPSSSSSSSSSSSFSGSSATALDRRLEQLKSLRQRHGRDPFEMDEDMMSYMRREGGRQSSRQSYRDYQEFQPTKGQEDQDQLFTRDQSQQPERMADSYCVDEITGLSKELERRMHRHHGRQGRHQRHEEGEDDTGGCGSGSVLEDDDVELDEEELEDDD